MMPGTVVEACGWWGGFTVLLAYELISCRTISCQRVFQLVNVGGAVMLAMNSAWHEAWPSVVVNGVWIAIGTAALIKADRSKNEIESSRDNQHRVLFLLGSARKGGNSEILARRAAAAIPDIGSQVWIRLADYPLAAFEDIRHEGQGVYPKPEGSAYRFLMETLQANHIVVVAPLYWYALPASVKLYLDHWSAWLRLPGVEFRARMKGKTLYAISSYSDQRPEVARPLFDSLRLTAAYMQMNYGGEILLEGNRPGDALSDTRALEEADRLFKFSRAPCGRNHASRISGQH